jgi:dienelactone hydrolase
MNQTARPHYADLGAYSDLVAAAESQRPLFPSAPPGPETRRKAWDVLGFTTGDEQPRDVRSERTWTADGIAGEEISWSVGFGPRSSAFLLKPEGARGKLPGILAFHDHGHFKFYGKERIADGPGGPLKEIVGYRATYYEGRAYANLLARQGFVVLATDCMMWGSRKFPLEVMPERERSLAEAVGRTLGHDAAGPEVVRYNGAAYLHEHVVARYCALLGTNITAVIAYEDRVALNLLRARDDVRPDRVGAMGFSGGGLRATALRATYDDLTACVVVGMMNTYDGLLDHSVAPHTWMLFPAGWGVRGDWPDLAACGAPLPLLVQCAIDDAQFTPDGMRAADARMAAHYASIGAAGGYKGEFYPGPHRFDAAMQDSAFAWLKEHLAG